MTQGEVHGSQCRAIKGGGKSAAPGLPSSYYDGMTRIRRLTSYHRITKLIHLAVFALVLAAISPNATAAEEVTLFNRDGVAAAFIDSGDLTIYLLNGEPVAYLLRENESRFSAFGYNGRHLGWYVNGIVYGHDGDAICAIADRLDTTHELEPHSRRQFVRMKAHTEPVPALPRFVNTFSAAPCDGLLQTGAVR